MFTSSADRQQTATVSFGRETRITSEGGYRFYAGLRSDPFFVEPEGFANNFQFTGHDVNLDQNVFGIVLEVPMDEMARGANFFNQTEEDKHTFNGTPPAQQRAVFLQKFVAVFQRWGYDEVEANRLALYCGRQFWSSRCPAR